MSDEQLIATPGVFGENGNFLLERELGRGGMGGVYMGRDKMLDRPVAVKVMLREYGNDPEFVEKFKKEAQAAARLIHPNIAQVYSYGISDGMPYIAMELVAGGSLDGLMKVHGADIEVPRVMKICEQVAQALRCAADQGLVHGDVKPENVLLDSNGNAKLVDFGLAAMQKDTNEIWGTPYYIAPEKVMKEPVDYRADMYSLGGTIYHALTGVAPFEGDDAVAVVRRRFEIPPPKPSEVRPGLSPQIDYLVTKMLARNPQDRYPSFEALLDDFKKVMTKGLTGTQSVAAAAMAGAEMESSGSGGKRLKLKSKRKFTVHRQPTGSQEDAVDDIPEVDENGEPITASRKFKTTRNLTVGDGGEASYDDEEGGSGSKALMVIGGVVLAIILVLGGLWALWNMNENKVSAAEQAKVDRGFATIEQNFKTLSAEVDRFEQQLGDIDKQAVKQCTAITKEVASIMEGVYPEEFIGMLKPAKTPDLMAAEAAMMAPRPAPGQAPTPEEIAAVSNAMNQVATAMAKEMANAMGQVANERANAVGQAVAGFPAPVGDEADPMSPAGKAYLEKRAKWVAEMKAKAAAPAEQPKAEEPAEAQAADDGLVHDKPACIDKVNALWAATYNSQAAMIRVKLALEALRHGISEKSAIPPPDKRNQATFDSYNGAQVSLNEEFNAIKHSKDVNEHLAKIRDLLSSRGKKAVKDCKETVKRIKEKKAQKALEEEAERRRKDEAERLEAERLARIEKEVAQAKDLYATFLSNGYIRQLDWRGCTNALLKARIEMKSGEGRLQADKEIQKICMMASVQDIIMRNLRGWTFKMGEGKDSKVPPIRNLTVTDVNERRIVMQDKKGKPREITWMKFYNDYHSNFGNLINTFIRNGNKNGEPKLSLRDRVNAMIGASLTLHIICSDDESSASFAYGLAKDALKAFPSYKETIQEIFPDLDFSDVEAATAAENL